MRVEKDWQKKKKKHTLNLYLGEYFYDNALIYLLLQNDIFSLF